MFWGLFWAPALSPKPIFLRRSASVRPLSPVLGLGWKLGFTHTRLCDVVLCRVWDSEPLCCCCCCLGRPPDGPAIAASEPLSAILGLLLLLSLMLSSGVLHRSLITLESKFSRYHTWGEGGVSKKIFEITSENESVFTRQRANQLSLFKNFASEHISQ